MHMKSGHGRNEKLNPVIAAQSKAGSGGLEKNPCLNYCLPGPLLGFTFPPLQIFHDLCRSYAKTSGNKKTKKPKHKKQFKRTVRVKIVWENHNKQRKLISLLQDFPGPIILSCLL